MSKNEQKLAVVTGGAGFVGSHLCARLVTDGWRVISLDNYFAGSKENHVAGVEYREGHTKGIAKHIQETPNIIFHLGEYSRVEQSLFEPEIVHDLNIRGTEGVIDFWRHKKCKLVYAGSSTKFGDGGKVREETPYASTKAYNSELVKKVGDKEGLPYVITYFYNVYGPGERAGIYGTLIESFKRMYLSGAPFAVTSPGTQVRNFTHVYDIVDGLILAAERGHGDEYGLGNEKSISVLEVARMFEGEIVMFPPRVGNRMSSSLDTSKIHALGWSTKRSLEEYVREFVRSSTRGASREKRVLVFSTTLFPAGPAEQAFLELAQKLPDVQFDVVAARFSSAKGTTPENVHLYRVGLGNSFDKYLLPILGCAKAARLARAHSYLFTWSLLAGYGALAAIGTRRIIGLPLLITLADQRFSELSSVKRRFLRIALSDADQVYGTSHSQEEEAQEISKQTLARESLGDGDAFANQLRYSYAAMLLFGK